MMTMTKRDAFTMAINVLEATDLENKAEAIEVIKSAIAGLDKASTRAATKKAENNKWIHEAIMTFLATVEKSTATMIHDNGDFKEPLSVQKITAALTQLVKEGKVVRTVEKKVSYFSLPLEG